MVTITDRIFLLGGYVSEDKEPIKSVLSLDCIDCQWRYVGELLRPRYYFVALVIPRNVPLDFNCSITTSTTTTTTTASTTAVADKLNNLNQATLFVIMILYFVLS